jgi:hypothetical protein
VELWGECRDQPRPDFCTQPLCARTPPLFGQQCPCPTSHFVVHGRPCLTQTLRKTTATQRQADTRRSARCQRCFHTRRESEDQDDLATPSSYRWNQISLVVLPLQSSCPNSCRYSAQRKLCSQMSKEWKSEQTIPKFVPPPSFNDATHDSVCTRPSAESAQTVAFIGMDNKRPLYYAILVA